MTPDLGKYAVEVTAAYGVSLLLLVALITWTLLRARRIKAALEDAEGRASLTDEGTAADA